MSLWKELRVGLGDGRNVGGRKMESGEQEDTQRGRLLGRGLGEFLKQVREEANT